MLTKWITMSRAATHHQRCMPNIVYQCRFMHARPAEAVHVRVQPTAPPLIGLRLPPRPPTLTPLPPLDVTLLQDLEARERRCAGGTLVAYRPRTHRYTNRGHWNTISKVQWRYSDDVLRHHLLFNRGLRACTPILPSLPRDMLLAMIYTRMDASSFQALLNQVRGHDAWRALPTRAQLRGVVPGYVYAFSNRQRSKVKIGITSEPVARKTWHRRCYGDTMNFDVLLPTPCVRVTEDLVHRHLALQPWCKPAEPILCRRCNVQHGEWFRGSAAFQRLKVADVEPVMVFSVLMVHLATRSRAPDAYTLRGGKVVRLKY